LLQDAAKAKDSKDGCCLQLMIMSELCEELSYDSGTWR